jgi:5-methylcytosine-specific restriction endonuclease McrA
MEIDEIIPVSKGGDPFDLANCQLTHRRCNQRKGNHAYTRLHDTAKPATPKPAPKPIPLSRAW